MRELLGGKGANVAEMTRILGPELVPAGFTITTEACVAYMQGGQEEPEGPVWQGGARRHRGRSVAPGDEPDKDVAPVRRPASTRIIRRYFRHPEIRSLPACASP